MLSVAETIPSPENDKELKLVVFTLAGAEFGMEIGRVREIIRVAEITKMPRAPRFLSGMINLRGRVVSILDFKKRFELPDCDWTADARIMVVEMGDLVVGLLVDKVLEVQRVSESRRTAPNRHYLGIPSQFLAGVVEAKGGLILLLDLERAFNLDEIKNLAGSERSVLTEERFHAR
ncbi:MAG: chemotaxis protein CheW [bacterium]